MDRKTDIICSLSCLILPWNTEEDIVVNVQAATFHTVKVNGDWGWQVKKKNAIDIVHKSLNLEYSIRVQIK